jgi:NitT/TauT family transport system substrate-binding protein
MKKIIFIAFGLIVVSGLLAGCAQQPTVDTTPIKIAALPILDVLPLYAAQEGGFFEKQGLKVEFIAVGSSAERDQVISAGQADGMVNDLPSLVLYNRKSIQIQVVRLARVNGPGAPLYRILASAKSGIKSVKELAGIEIGISQGSVIDFVTTSILTGEGLKADEIKTIAVPKIPDRLSLLESGQLKAATLPEPFATIALGQGAVLIVDDLKYPDSALSTIAFRKQVMDERSSAVKKFVAAVDQAVEDINANPEKYRKLLEQYKLVPAALVQTYPMPKFPTNGLPTENQFNLVNQWALGKGLIDQKLDYASSIKAP